MAVNIKVSTMHNEFIPNHTLKQSIEVSPIIYVKG